jgi:hypothetical protein
MLRLLLLLGYLAQMLLPWLLFVILTVSLQLAIILIAPQEPCQQINWVAQDINRVGPMCMTTPATPGGPKCASWAESVTVVLQVTPPPTAPVTGSCVTILGVILILNLTLPVTLCDAVQEGPMLLALALSVPFAAGLALA